MANISHTNVAKISRISNDANKLFLRPNCKGEKAKLKIKFRMNGNKTKKAILPLKNKNPTYPNDTAMMIYKTVQTGPNNHDGGAQDGLINRWYQVNVSIRTLY